MKSAVLPAMAAAFFAQALWPQAGTAPTLVRKVEPHYTLEAQRKNIEGKVSLYAEIGIDGQAHNFRVLHSLGSGLDENAIRAVEQWRFRPGLDKNGHQVRVACSIEVSFRLHNPVQEPQSMQGAVRV